MNADIQIALTMLQLIALLYPAVGLVLEALVATSSDTGGAVWGDREFVLMQLSFVVLSLAALAIFWFLAATGVPLPLLIGSILTLAAMGLLSYSLFAMSGLSSADMIQEALGKR